MGAYSRRGITVLRGKLFFGEDSHARRDSPSSSACSAIKTFPNICVQPHQLKGLFSTYGVDLAPWFRMGLTFFLLAAV